jgi:hypothetical protein
MKKYMYIKLLLVVLLVLSVFLVSAEHTSAGTHIPTGWDSCSDPTPSSGEAIQPKIGCECGQLFQSNTVIVEVECGDGLVCSNNKFNPFSYSVCLRKTGVVGGKCTQTTQCEGGAECRPSTTGVGTFCTVDLGEESLAGVVGNTTTDIRETIRRVINVLLGFLGIVTVLMIIYGGVLWLTAAGNEEKIDKGRHTITWAAIGAIIISIAWTIASYVLNVGKSV